ncbi:hypothetical protein F441_06561 [Phytophthora nicotianae CJ01A1]|uniref:Uncharacterized protein n=6 Tax=Phytophthora nicotianae TaxID=4792 RepID=W2RE06_PHYN3|nr:hypothetical protein PPTG_20959 [Phytophthora nicotianae INRA-310]ETI49798.1 hypothetical protein F443_06556 [Phytophthora nicotianae P1569]ETK89562.1 hypothetical protein L915_06425 [Phytophthora nicotianae]ETO78354.1 hypothetical protein F444_06622 [Phytophthora nicotianae P1976]ETP19435.1 hypothetical protein F441_06561 [Phytophthora nicotianae CJ01A1]ETP47354.1 hypothetical protein F442_06600 [Phytophthora nicotianae P10297]
MKLICHVRMQTQQYHRVVPPSDDHLIVPVPRCFAADVWARGIFADNASSERSRYSSFTEP